MATTAILEDFKRLEQLYTTGFQDVFLDNALRKIIERQIARDEADLKRVNEDLAEFEGQYGLSSVEFWRRFQAGQMADTADFMEWNILYKMRQRITARLSILRGDGFHE
jgi:hypothetical protein